MMNVTGSFGSLFFFEWMFHFACHKRVRIFFKDTMAGAGAEVESLAAIDGAWLIGRVIEFAPTGSFVFGHWCSGSFSQFQFSL